MSNTDDIVEKFKEGSPKISAESTLDAVWCVDSETGDRVLMDRRTNKEIGRWRKS